MFTAWFISVEEILLPAIRRHLTTYSTTAVVLLKLHRTQILERLGQKRKKAWNIERRSVLMRRKTGLMYERMCFRRGKGKVMAAGYDTVLVLQLCQYLLWLSSTFPLSWLMLPSQPQPTSLKTETSKLRWSASNFCSARLHFSLVLVLTACNKHFWGTKDELGHDAIFLARVVHGKFHLSNFIVSIYFIGFENILFVVDYLTKTHPCISHKNN